MVVYQHHVVASSWITAIYPWRSLSCVMMRFCSCIWQTLLNPNQRHWVQGRSINPHTHFHSVCCPAGIELQHAESLTTQHTNETTVFERGIMMLKCLCSSSSMPCQKSYINMLKPQCATFVGGFCRKLKSYSL